MFNVETKTFRNVRAKLISEFNESNNRRAKGPAKTPTLDFVETI